MPHSLEQPVGPVEVDVHVTPEQVIERILVPVQVILAEHVIPFLQQPSTSASLSQTPGENALSREQCLIAYCKVLLECTLANSRADLRNSRMPMLQADPACGNLSRPSSWVVLACRRTQPSEED